MKKLFDQREIARLLGISETRVRRWERRGLVPRLKKTGGTSWFDFQALVAFRTLRQLRGQGVSLAKIGKCVAKMRRLLPELKQPLSEVRISIHRRQIVLGRDRLKFTPEGQRLIDFGGPENLPIPLARQDYEGLFHLALEDEEAGRLDEARGKYEAILAARPDHADAMVNLGNLLYLAGAETAAAARYLQALGVDPDHVEGNYNLANLLEGQGELASAAIFYRKALCGDPEFADGHFNLAMVLEGTGDLSGARSHWRRFLELNPTSKWAGFARSRLNKDEGPRGES
ncbi:MAG: tetratricopeptide repeat protein [Desulfobaccales bacterium]